MKKGLLRKIVKKHKKEIRLCLLLLMATVFLAAGVWYVDQSQLAEQVGLAMRADAGGNDKSSTFSFRAVSEEAGEAEVDDDAEQIDGEITLSVSATERSEEEAIKLLDAAVAEWESSFLGSNPSVNEVRESLSLPSTVCDGLVTVTYESANTAVLKKDGTIVANALDDDGVLVELTAHFTCGEYTRIEVQTLCILPPEKGSTAWVLQQVLSAAESAEEGSRDVAVFSLPDCIDGYRIIWQEEKSYRWIAVLLLGVTVTVLLLRESKEKEKKKIRQRRDALEWEYPQMVELFSVLLDSGMPVRKAWERILRAQRNAKKHRYYTEEMWITYREIHEGRGEREAYERFGDRIGLMPYKRFSSILTQNLAKGTRNLKELLRQEAEEAMKMRCMRARKLGEEAGTKLLFPMLVMLVFVLVILLLPAMVNL